MKNIVVGLGLVIILFTMSCTSTSYLPIVRDENVGDSPLTISVVFPPDSVNSQGNGSGGRTIGFMSQVAVSINYTWNGKKSEFEQRQNAAGRITYRLLLLKKAGGEVDYSHSGGKLVDLQETGIIKRWVTGPVESSRKTTLGKTVIVTGGGRLVFGIYCAYRDKDGKWHEGDVSNRLEVPVMFARNPWDIIMGH